MTTDAAPLPPGATVGILGGGQLGRMLAMAAARLGLGTVIYEPDPAAPAAQTASRHVAAAYDDAAALADFAAACDVVTYEFENVPVAAIDAIDAIAPVFPPRRALAISQDRLEEKRFVRGLDIATAPFAVADSADDLVARAREIGFPGILKTRRLGYDGKGQQRIADESELARTLDGEEAGRFIYEGFVAFDREVSVIAARDRSGNIAAYDPGENVHRNGILATTTLPATLTPGEARQAVDFAGRMLTALDYVGVIGVEFFVTGAGLMVNEFAPRVHNSGHWTEAACLISQFEQHIRAVAGWPLGAPDRHADCVMENLIGDDVERWRTLAAEPGHLLHLYGKAETRAGRKMGHVTRISPRNG